MLLRIAGNKQQAATLYPCSIHCRHLPPINRLQHRLGNTPIYPRQEHKAVTFAGLHICNSLDFIQHGTKLQYKMADHAISPLNGTSVF